jgi:DNA-binding transcriptional regulator YiaG
MRSWLEGELLVTDSLKGIKRTPFQERRLAARKEMLHILLEDVKSIKEPSEEDIQLLLKETVNLGYSQQALAAAMGVTTGTLSRWIGGENKPRDFVRDAIVGHIIQIIKYTLDRAERLEQPRRPGQQPNGPRRAANPFGHD